MHSPVYIHGMGLITPLGGSPMETFAAIQSGRTVCDSGHVPDEYLAPVSGHISGLKLSSRQLPAALDRSILLGLGALLAAREGACWTAEELRDPETAVFVATSKGPAISWLAAIEQLHQSGHQPLEEDLAWHVMMGAGAMGAAARAVFGLCGPAHTTVAACAGSLVAVHRAVAALRTGEYRRAVVVAADSSCHPLFEGCYQNLGVLAAPDADGHRRCRPFSPREDGFIVSQAGAAMLLSLEKPKQAKTQASVKITETWTGAEGMYLVGADPQGKRLGAGIQAILPSSCGQAAGNAGVAFVHAHAAGTGHDNVERRVIQACCGDVPIFSHKAWLGHSLGASGLVGLALSAVCHQQCRTLTGEGLAVQAESLTLAQGFGGHIAMCRLSRNSG